MAGGLRLGYFGFSGKEAGRPEIIIVCKACDFGLAEAREKESERERERERWVVSGQAG
jgi:hypothetical protein